MHQFHLSLAETKALHPKPKHYLPTPRNDLPSPPSEKYTKRFREVKDGIAQDASWSSRLEQTWLYFLGKSFPGLKEHIR